MNTNYYWNILRGWDANLMNTLETSDSYIINLRAIGVKKEDLKISIKSDTLSITSGESEEDKKSYIRREFYPDTLNINLKLPGDINLEEIDASLENGILEIRIPKKLQEAKQIQIK